MDNAVSITLTELENETIETTHKNSNVPILTQSIHANYFN